MERHDQKAGLPLWLTMLGVYRLLSFLWQAKPVEQRNPKALVKQREKLEMEEDIRYMSYPFCWKCDKTKSSRLPIGRITDYTCFSGTKVDSNSMNKKIWHHKLQGKTCRQSRHRSDDTPRAQDHIFLQKAALSWSTYETTPHFEKNSRSVSEFTSGLRSPTKMWKWPA